MVFNCNSQVFKELEDEEEKDTEVALSEVATDTIGSLFALAQSSARSQSGSEAVTGGSDAETFLTALMDVGGRAVKSDNTQHENSVRSNDADASSPVLQLAEPNTEQNNEGK